MRGGGYVERVPPCPSRRSDGSVCAGELQRIRPNAYACQACRKLFGAGDVRALGLAAARPPPGPGRRAGRQLRLPFGC